MKMFNSFKKIFEGQLQDIRNNGLWKNERILAGPQQGRIIVKDGREVLNLCSNNYLGLANHPDIIQAAHKGLDKWGYGLSSVRFICGTQKIHKELEKKITEFLGTEDTILYNSCFDANGGLFETLLSEQDVIISDELNHASIIDGIRLCKAQRLRFKTNDMDDLEKQLKSSQNARIRLVATDGVFSMDGTIADLGAICDLAEKYGCLVMMDDSHGVGVLGNNGKGTHEYRNVIGRVDIITGTFGKALGGATGGYTSGRKEIIDLLRQKSRPYLFSNTLPPSVVTASIKALEIISTGFDIRKKLMDNTEYFRKKITELNFDIKEGVHPIIPIMLKDAVLAQKSASFLLEKGIYVIGFFYPVVPKDTARIRVQISASHTKEDLDFAISSFSQLKSI
jgi:glycine C-acetyltransferase